jgi:hypothetical protein
MCLVSVARIINMMSAEWKLLLSLLNGVNSMISDANLRARAHGLCLFSDACISSSD